MYNANFMELETNISFDCEIDDVPRIKQNFTTVFMGKKKVKRPTSVERYGKFQVTLQKIGTKEINFLKKWAASKKRIDLMVETAENIYIIKRSYVKEFLGEDSPLVVYYNDFRES